MLLNGTPEQKKKLIREYLTGESESSSGDEFEKEMEAELSTTIKTIEGTWGPSTAGKSELNVCVSLSDIVMTAFLTFVGLFSSRNLREPRWSCGWWRRRRRRRSCTS